MAKDSTRKYTSTRTRNLRNNGTPYHGKFEHGRRRYFAYLWRRKEKNDRRRARQCRKQFLEGLMIIGVPTLAIFLIYIAFKLTH